MATGTPIKTPLHLGLLSLFWILLACMSWEPWRAAPNRLPNAPLIVPGKDVELEWRCGNMACAPAEDCEARWRDAKGRYHGLDPLLAAAEKLIARAPATPGRHVFFLVSFEPLVIVQGPSSTEWDAQRLASAYKNQETFGRFEHYRKPFIVLSKRLPLRTTIVWATRDGWKQAPFMGDRLELAAEEITISLLQSEGMWLTAAEGPVRR